MEPRSRRLQKRLHSCRRRFCRGWTSWPRRRPPFALGVTRPSSRPWSGGSGGELEPEQPRRAARGGGRPEHAGCRGNIVRSSNRQPLLLLASFVVLLEQQVSALSLASAQALFAMTLAVTVAGQDHLIESIAFNEAFGQIYLYRLLLREARQQAI